MRAVRDTPFELGTRVTLIGIFGPGGFWRSRNGQQVRVALEKLFALLEFAAPPVISVVELLNSSRSPRRRTCAGRYFAVIAVPGSGDLILEFRSRVLVERVNALLAKHWDALSLPRSAIG